VRSSDTWLFAYLTPGFPYPSFLHSPVLHAWVASSALARAHASSFLVAPCQLPLPRPPTTNPASTPNSLAASEAAPPRKPAKTRELGLPLGNFKAWPTQPITTTSLSKPSPSRAKILCSEANSGYLELTLACHISHPTHHPPSSPLPRGSLSAAEPTLPPPWVRHSLNPSLKRCARYCPYCAFRAFRRDPNSPSPCRPCPAPILLRRSTRSASALSEAMFLASRVADRIPYPIISCPRTQETCANQMPRSPDLLQWRR
jgi:hypothetical protein